MIFGLFLRELNFVKCRRCGTETYATVAGFCNYCVYLILEEWYEENRSKSDTVN